MRTLLLVPFAAGLAAGCEPVQPCDDYVDYMCRCHEQDTGTDCQTLTASYQDADAKIQDECAALLNDQEAADQKAGVCVDGR